MTSKTPSQNPVVISNTTPIITLSAINHLDLLHHLYGHIFIPDAVKNEIMAGEYRHGAQELKEAKFIVSVPIKNFYHASLLSDLDRGEAEAIALAIEKQADLLVIDERLGRRHASRLEIPITGSVGVLLRAKERGLISVIKPLLKEIQDAGVYLSTQLVQKALLEAKEL